MNYLPLEKQRNSYISNTNKISSASDYSSKKYGRRNPDNVIKLELIPLSIMNFKIHYERVVNDNISAEVTLGFLPYRSIPFQGLLNIDSDDKDFIEKAKIDGFSMSPEIRYYWSPEQDVPEGFYFSGFAKYSTFGFYSQKLYSNPDHDVLGTVEARLSRYGINAGMGYQWIIADIISIDFTFLALGIELYQTNGTVTSDEFTEFDLKDINKDIVEDFDRDGFGKLDTQIGFNYVKAKQWAIMPATRFTISIGFGFD